MATTIKLWTMEEDFGEPTVYNKAKVSEDETYASLRLRLEEKSALEWPFDFWDKEEGSRVPQKMESFSDMPADVFVLPLGNEISGVASKRRRLDDAGTRCEALPEDGNCALGCEAGAVPDLANSRASVTSGVTNSLEHQCHSTLISEQIWERCLEHGEKLKRELQCASLEDNRWLLKTADINGHGVVKFFCVECCKEIGGGGQW